MPRFFIHFRDADGLLTEDPEGLELPDLDAVRREAVGTGKQALAHHLLAGGVLSEAMTNSLVVADEGGRTVAVVTYAEAAELAGPKPTVT